LSAGPSVVAWPLRAWRRAPITEASVAGYPLSFVTALQAAVNPCAGPVDPATFSLLGASKELIFNNDFIFTISQEAKLNGVIFFDYGKGFGADESVSFNLRKSAGLEGRWISPFGPLRAAYGINLSPREGERKGVFEFTIGSIF